MLEEQATESKSLLQPWMLLLIMPLIGLVATIFILTGEDPSTNTSQNNAQNDTAAQMLNDATPVPRTLPPRTAIPTPTSVFNQPVPQSPLRTIDGEAIALADFEGKALILNFWATWCEPCEEEMPALQAFYDRYREEDIALLLITDPYDGQDEATIQAYVERLNIDLPIVFSEYGQLNRLLGVRVLPSTYFVDAEGNTRSYWVGPIEVEDLENEVARLIEE